MNIETINKEAEIAAAVKYTAVESLEKYLKEHYQLSKEVRFPFGNNFGFIIEFWSMKN